VLFVFLVIAYVNFDNQKLRILGEDIREKIHTLDLGVSKFTNINSDAESFGEKLQFVIAKIPVFIKGLIFHDSNDYLETINLDLKFKNLQQILSDRSKAIEKGLLTNSTYVNADIYYKKKKYKAKVKLKGDLKDHWLSQYRYSLRVKLKKGQIIMGMNEFDIQKPRSRQFPFDTIFERLFTASGGLSNAHQFANIIFNGKEWGVMNIESRPSKIFLEKSQRKDSLVFKFSNEESWLYNLQSYVPDESYKLSDPTLFSSIHSDKKIKNTLMRKIYSYVLTKRLNNDDSNLYDLSKYSDLFLMSYFWGSDHTLYANNVKHYFNPYTLLLEPIASDQVEIRYKDFSKCASNNRHYIDRILRKTLNSSFFDKEFDKKVTAIKKIYKTKLNAIVQEVVKIFPNNQSIKLDFLNKKLESNINSDELKRIKICNTKNVINKASLASDYFDHIAPIHFDDGEIRLFNLTQREINIHEIEDSFGNLIKVDAKLKPYNVDNNQFYSLKTDQKGLKDNSLYVVSSLQENIRKNRIQPTLLKDGVFSPFEMYANVPKFFQKIGDGEWYLPPGNWSLKNPIFINGTVKISKGASLHFTNQSFMIVKGSLIAMGTLNEPIKFLNSDKISGGLYIFNDYKMNRSVLKNVNFDNFLPISDGVLNLTGGITFYNSDVELDNVNIFNAKSEDALNIVKSNFLINDINIVESISDAVDFDFSTGVINGGNISNIKGDALDFSGSKVIVKNINIKSVGDKAISAGEASNIEIYDSYFNKVLVGIASKDGSSVLSENNVMDDVSFAKAMTYQKKNFYAYPTLNLIEKNTEDNSKIFAQNGTSLYINGKIQQTIDIDIDNLYKTLMKK